MTFPIVEIFCPECKERMTLINKPEMAWCTHPNGYDQVIDYHYQCKSKEQYPDLWEDYINGKKLNYDAYTDKEIEKLKNSGWCNISKHNYILIMRILIPNLSEGEKERPKQETVLFGEVLHGTRVETFVPVSKPPCCEFYNKKYCPPCPEHYYDCDLVKIGNQIKIDKWKPNITIEDLKRKSGLLVKKYPNTDLSLMFMKIGEKVWRDANFTIDDVYDVLKEIIEVMNPANKELDLEPLGEKALFFFDKCLDIALGDT